MKNLQLSILAISMAAVFCLSAEEVSQQASDAASTAQPSQGESVALEQASDVASDSAANQAENQSAPASEMSVPSEAVIVPAKKKERISAARAAMEAEQKIWETWNPNSN